MSKKHKNKQQNKPVEQPIKVANIVKEKKKWSINRVRIPSLSPKVYLTKCLVSIVGGFSTRFQGMVTGLITPFVLLRSSAAQVGQTVQIRSMLAFDSLLTMRYNEALRQHVASALIVVIGSFLIMKAAGM